MGNVTRNSDAGQRNADRIYGEIREKILSMEFAPGSVIDEAAIVQKSGVSRTPVREAIIRLVSEGLLLRDGRQVRVASFDISQLRDVFESLMLLSRSMHRLAALRRQPAHLTAMWRALQVFEAEADAPDEVRLSEANHLFHMEVSKAGASSVLHRFYETMSIETLRLSRQCFIVGDRTGYVGSEHLKQTMQDHRDLFAAIEAGDGDEADRVAQRHTVLFRERLTRQLLGMSGDIDSFRLQEEPGLEPSGRRSQ
jgi:DNA-binding GntR family transcriptional regulator